MNRRSLLAVAGCGLFSDVLGVFTRWSQKVTAVRVKFRRDYVEIRGEYEAVRKFVMDWQEVVWPGWEKSPHRASVDRELEVCSRDWKQTGVGRISTRDWLCKEAVYKTMKNWGSQAVVI